MSSNSAEFLRHFVRNPARVGAVTPSSPGLTRKLVGWPDLDRAQAVAEYGTGTGVVTEAIVESLPVDCQFFAIEIDPEMAALTRRLLPGTTVYQDSVANVRALCDREGIDSLDCVVAGIPWANIPASEQTEYMDALTTVLRPGGQFVTFAYLHGLLLPAGRRFQGLLSDYFAEVSRSTTVWSNLPPAFVYQCRR